jgi:hypothetical protein
MAIYDCWFKDERGPDGQRTGKHVHSASSSSSSSSSDSSSTDSSDQPADWANFDQWEAETAPNPGNAGSWSGNPGPFGAFGLAFNPGSGPGAVGGFDGVPPFLGGRGDVTGPMMVELLGQVVAAIHAQPAKNAAATAAAMNGVAGTAIVRGNW